MERMTAVRRGVFGAVAAAALGFGATQALAAPAPASSGAKVCDEALCDRICDPTNRGLGGFCSSTGACVCWR